MNPAAQLLKADPIKLAIGVALVAGVGYLLLRQLGKDAGKAVGKGVDAIANVNEGTPYEGTGVVGTLGHATNVVTGNWLDNLGGWIGRGIYDITH